VPARPGAEVVDGDGLHRMLLLAHERSVAHADVVQVLAGRTRRELARADAPGPGAGGSATGSLQAVPARPGVAAGVGQAQADPAADGLPAGGIQV
jgi:hypothetical protein